MESWTIDPDLDLRNEDGSGEEWRSYYVEGVSKYGKFSWELKNAIAVDNQENPLLGRQRMSYQLTDYALHAADEVWF